MSKLKYSLGRNFSAYILLMYYQRTDPWVDSDHRVISQRRYKANLVYDNRWEDFVAGCSCYPKEKTQRKKMLEDCSLGLGDRKPKLNKTSVLFLTSHLSKKVLVEKNGSRKSHTQWLRGHQCISVTGWALWLRRLAPTSGP